MRMSNTTDWQTLEHFTFGDSPAMADELLELVLQGVKTATCSSAAENEIRYVGLLTVACDGRGRARAVIETTELRFVPFDGVEADFAAAEGEGDRTLAWWRQAHQSFFERNGGFTPTMLLRCERFRVVQVIE